MNCVCYTQKNIFSWCVCVWGGGGVLVKSLAVKMLTALCHKQDSTNEIRAA